MKYSKENPLKVFTTFSGYDSQCMALRRLNIPFDLVGWSEFDPYSNKPIEKQPAVMAHNAVFPEYKDRNHGDISKINWDDVPNFDLLTYSPPCQDFSQAGLQRGGESGSGTRSSLLWQCEKAIIQKRPKFLVFENVPNLISKRFINTFKLWQIKLQNYGYTNFSKVLNARDYGIPQNRKRLFMISIYECNQGYIFPKPFELKNKLKDLLDDNVDKKYYLKQEGIRWRMNITNKNSERNIGYKFAPTNGDCIASTITTCAGSREYDNYIYQQSGIRKLTEIECLRLMGVCDDDITKIKKTGMSRTQSYKLAGNSIVVDVLCYIFRNLFFDKNYDDNQLSIFDF